MSSFVLDGPVGGCRSFADAYGKDGQAYYFADDGSQAEWGIGTMRVGNPDTLERSTIIGTTAGSLTKLSFDGVVTIRSWPPSVRTPLLNDDGTLDCADVSATDTPAAINARSMHAMAYGRDDMSRQFLTPETAQATLVASQGSERYVVNLPGLQLIFCKTMILSTVLPSGHKLKLSSLFGILPSAAQYSSQDTSIDNSAKLIPGNSFQWRSDGTLGFDPPENGESVNNILIVGLMAP